MSEVCLTIKVTVSLNPPWTALAAMEDISSHWSASYVVT